MVLFLPRWTSTAYQLEKFMLLAAAIAVDAMCTGTTFPKKNCVFYEKKIQSRHGKWK